MAWTVYFRLIRFLDATSVDQIGGGVLLGWVNGTCNKHESMTIFNFVEDLLQEEGIYKKRHQSYLVLCVAKFLLLTAWI